MPTINALELANGAIGEQVSNELDKVLKNLVDPNTDIKTKSKITVTLTFEVDENRETVKCSAQAKAVLAAVKPITTTLWVDTDHKGNVVATEPSHDKSGNITGGEVKHLRSVN